MTAFLRAGFWTRNRVLALLASLAVLVGFAAANAHLVAVAVMSQPDCVPHLRTSMEGAAIYRAAKPSC
jgi:hypothetical protein